MDGLSRLFLPAPVAKSAPAPGPGPAPALPQQPRGQTCFLDDPRLAAVARALGAAVDQLRGHGDGGGDVVLVLDQPDVLLAAAGPGYGVTGASLRDMVLDLREVSFLPPLAFFLKATVTTTRVLFDASG